MIGRCSPHVKNVTTSKVDNWCQTVNFSHDLNMKGGGRSPVPAATLRPGGIFWGYNPMCKVTPVILHGVVSPDISPSGLEFKIVDRGRLHVMIHREATLQRRATWARGREEREREKREREKARKREEGKERGRKREQRRKRERGRKKESVRGIGLFTGESLQKRGARQCFCSLERRPSTLNPQPSLLGYLAHKKAPPPRTLQ